MAENGNGKKANAVKLVVPITVVGVFMAFGVSAGMYVQERDKRISDLEKAMEQKLDKWVLQGWVREARVKDPNLPEAPR